MNFKYVIKVRIHQHTRYPCQFLVQSLVMDLMNIDPALRHGVGAMVLRLESIFESIVDSLLRNEEMRIDIMSSPRSHRGRGDVR
jgi:hypothetical protein